MHFTSFIIPMIAALGVSAAPAAEDERVPANWQWDITDYTVDVAPGGTQTYFHIKAPALGKTKGFEADCYASNYNKDYVPCLHGEGNGKHLGYFWKYNKKHAGKINQEIRLVLPDGTMWGAEATNTLQTPENKPDYTVTAWRLN